MKVLKILPNIKRTLSFRSRIAISFVVIILIITVVMSITSLQLASNIVLESSKKIAEKNFKVVYESLDDYFRKVDSYTTLLIRSKELQNVIQIESETNIEPLASSNLYRTVHQVIGLSSSDNNITFNNIIIYCKNGYNYSYSKTEGLPYDDYDSCVNYLVSNNYISNDYNSSTWCNLLKTKDMSGKATYSFFNIRPLYDTATFKEIGLIVSSIPESDLYNCFSDFSDEAYIVHKNGQIVSHSDKSILGTSLIDDPVFNMIITSSGDMNTIHYENNHEVKLFTYKKLAYNNTLFVVPFDYYNEQGILDNSSFYLPMLIVFISILLLAILFTIFISKGLSSSVVSLKNTVQSVQDGNLDARFSSKRNDEVAFLGNMFNNLMDQISKLFDTQKEHERTNHTLELKLMQAQINPHLLYNTLDSTLWALDNKNIPQAKLLIISLSEFFKTTLSGGNTLIPLEKELQLVRNYITIQNIARGKNINLIINCEKRFMKIPFLKLSIQPIIENAIIHGFSGFRDDGKIEITVIASENKFLEIVTKDNGIGMMEEEVKAIKNMLDSSLTHKNITHFGLYNIQRRIKNVFGDRYGLQIKSEVGEYTTATISIPFEFEQRKDTQKDV